MQYGRAASAPLASKQLSCKFQLTALGSKRAESVVG